MSRLRVYDWHKRYKRPKSACMLKSRVKGLLLRIRKMMLFVFFDHRDIVHHEIVL